MDDYNVVKSGDAEVENLLDAQVLTSIWISMSAADFYSCLFIQLLVKY